MSKVQDWVKANHLKHPCKVCGQPVKVFAPYWYREGGPHIPDACSRRCAVRLKNPPHFKTCVVCGQDFQTPPSHTHRVTCGRECYKKLLHERMSRHGNPHWRDGLQGLKRHIKSLKLFDDFRAAVLARDGNCVDCGAAPAKRRKTHTLDVHHHISVDELLSLLFDPDNGVALCPDCHTVRHLT